MPLNCHKACRAFDVYGKPVSMTYKGSQSYRTAFGGCVTFLLFGFVTSLFIYKLAQIEDHNASIIQKLTFENADYGVSDIVDLGESGFNFGVSIIDDNTNVAIQDFSRYITLKARKIIANRPSDNSTTMSTTDVTLERCNWDRTGFRELPEQKRFR